MLNADEQAFLDRQAEEIRVHAEGKQSQREWDTVRGVLAFGGRPPKSACTLPMRCDKEGNPTPALAKIAEHMQTYFGDIEHARQLTPQALVD
eukprot:3503891-Pyramimonas_sp.AAC.1